MSLQPLTCTDLLLKGSDSAGAPFVPGGLFSASKNAALLLTELGLDLRSSSPLCCDTEELLVLQCLLDC